MRKNLFIIAAAFILAACGGSKGNSDTAGQGEGINAIEQGWREKDIPVDNGGAKPDVMQLVKAFNAVWPFTATDSLIAKVGDSKYVRDDAGVVYVDCEDFHTASYSRGESGDNMEARAYDRENGHTLFAICLEQNGMEYKKLACFYDYDPKTSKMTPEDEPYKGFKPTLEGGKLILYTLGCENDQTILLKEIGKDGEETFHHFVFNGTKHEFSHSGDEVDAADEEGEGTELPDFAEKVDECDDYFLYKADAGEGTVIWVYNRNTGVSKEILNTADNHAEADYDAISEGRSVTVEGKKLAFGECSQVMFIVCMPGKILVEGCPDSRNIISYIYDFNTGKGIQLPTNEGLRFIDCDEKQLHMKSYRYHEEDGRYSVGLIYDFNGKLKKEEGKLEDY